MKFASSKIYCRKPLRFFWWDRSAITEYSYRCTPWYLQKWEKPKVFSNFTFDPYFLWMQEVIFEKQFREIRLGETLLQLLLFGCSIVIRLCYLNYPDPDPGLLPRVVTCVLSYNRDEWHCKQWYTAILVGSGYEQLTYIIPWMSCLMM